MNNPNGSTISPESKTRSKLELTIHLNSAIRVTAEALASVNSGTAERVIGGDAFTEAPASVNLSATRNIKGGNGTSGVGGPANPRTTRVFERHDKQLSKGRIIGGSNGLIAELNNLPGLIIDATEYCACYEVDDAVQQLKSLNQEQIFRSYLYLFNVLIAFEWKPSKRTVQRVQLAAKKASDFLYDVTDGFMAFGQVILGGCDLLDVADIQIMASNRFHPRSWISALHEPHKFQPIRLGRGLWRKDQGFVVPWDESDSYRVLVHEWGHYALELVDEYLDLVQLDRTGTEQKLWQGTMSDKPILRGQEQDHLDIVAPSIALPIDSIMSTLASSELLPRHGPREDKQRKYMQEKIKNHFPEVALETPLEGPAELPLSDLPVFKQSDLGATEEEVQLSGDHLKQLHALLTPHSDLKIPSSSWVYVLKSSAKNAKDRARIVGQGVLSNRDWDEGFRLLGATERDQVVVVAQIVNTETHTAWVEVVRGDLRKVESEKVDIGWVLVTPKALPDFIDVLPAEMRPVTKPDHSQLLTKLNVQIESRDLPPEVVMSALGQEPKPLTFNSSTPVSNNVSYSTGSSRTRWISDPVDLNALDGHVLLRWGDGTMYICGYSHGGGPCTGGGGYCICYTAGSYEGNSMLFYRDNYDASDRSPPQLIDNQVGDQGLRIVSTVMQGGEQYLLLSSNGSNSFSEARSYIFSLGSNQPLNTHSATLVLYYDSNARKHNGDLLIYRWKECKDKGAHWQRLTTYAPENQPYLCISLDEATPETSGGTNGRDKEYFDRYRIYWTPRSQRPDEGDEV